MCSCGEAEQDTVQIYHMSPVLFLGFPRVKQGFVKSRTEGIHFSHPQLLVDHLTEASQICTFL
jgi:hypothetical protein